MIKYFRVGQILSTHALKGECKIYPTSTSKKRFDNLTDCFLIDSTHDIEKDIEVAKAFKIEKVKYLNKFVIIKFKNIDDISEAEKYIGYDIYIDRIYAEELKENEYYIPDLIGADILDENENYIAKVKDVCENKASFNLLVEKENKEYFVPFVKDFIEKIDIKNNKIIIKSDRGLFE